MEVPSDILMSSKDAQMLESLYNSVNKSDSGDGIYYDDDDGTVTCPAKSYSAQSINISTNILDDNGVNADDSLTQDAMDRIVKENQELRATIDKWIRGRGFQGS